jgi:hypothetical protein
MKNPKLLFFSAFAALLMLSSSAWAQRDADQSDSTQDSQAETASGGQAGLKAARDLAIKDKEFEKIEDILGKGEGEVSQARAEIQIVQAKIARSLLDEEPKLSEIRAMIKESLDWEMKVRLIQIERQIAVKKVIGDKRWSVLVKLMKSPLVRARLARDKGKNAENARFERLLGIMDRLR